MKTADPEAGPVDRIMMLAHEIIDECPACAGKASEIALWAGQIRERRPGRAELEALVDGACQGLLPDERRTLLIDSLQAMVRFAE
jgi:hypothetical protein